METFTKTLWKKDCIYIAHVSIESELSFYLIEKCSMPYIVDVNVKLFCRFLVKKFVGF